MLDRLFGYKVHNLLHVLGMSVLAFGLPLNKVLMSIGAIWGVSNLVLEGNFKTYWINIKSNKVFFWLFAFFSLHLIGLIWSNDIKYAMHDLLIKLPLLSVPLAFVARPISERKSIHFILYALLFSLLFTSIANFGFYFQWFGYKHYSDFRQLSLFGSHIRYGILIVLGAATCIYFLLKSNTIFLKIMWLLIFSWFSFYTFYSQVLSGAISLILVIIIFIFYFLNHYSKLLTISFGLLIVSVFIVFVSFLIPSTPTKIDYSTLPKKTIEGNDYANNLNLTDTEDNKRIYISVCEYELQREWTKLSKMPYYKPDKINQPLNYTLMRYLTSKNLSKDAVGMKKLTKTDIVNIENGIASINQLKMGVIGRLYSVKHEINNNYDPNGHSLLQRFEYWKTAGHIIQQNWLIGVGNGDVQNTFDYQYEKDKSLLLPKFRVRAHNMYLTVWISFGIVGLLIFILFITSYFRQAIKNNEILAVMFISIAIVTFMIEDTIETQLGVCIFSLFVGLFINKIDEETKNKSFI